MSAVEESFKVNFDDDPPHETITESSSQRRGGLRHRLSGLNERTRRFRNHMTVVPGGQAYVANSWTGPHRSNLFKYAMEFFGTFVLNLNIASFYEGIYGQFHPLAVTATIIVVVTMGAPVSGAHYNPALTAGFYFAGDRCAPSVVIYTVVIITAAIAANFLAYALDLGQESAKGPGVVGSGLPVWNDTGKWAQACAGELIGTYCAIFVVLWTAMLAKPPLGTFSPVLVGLGFYSCIMTFRLVSGSVLNPGLALGIWLVGIAAHPEHYTTRAGCVPQYWGILLYIFFEMLGGTLAGLTAKAWIVHDAAKAKMEEEEAAHAAVSAKRAAHDEVVQDVEKR